MIRIATLFFFTLSLFAADDTAELLRELIRIDTSNPPGNEAKVAEFLKAKLAPLGFQITDQALVSAASA